MIIQDKQVDLHLSHHHNVPDLVMMAASSGAFRVTLWMRPDELEQHAKECLKMAEVCRKFQDPEGDFVRDELKGNFKPVK